MPELADLIRASTVPDGPSVERAVFGSSDPEMIASWYERLCREVLGTDVRHALFYAASVGCIGGVELADGRRLALKAYQRRWDLRLLELVSSAQRHLASAGFPCPMPACEPLTFDGVPVSVEQVLDDTGVRVLAPDEMEVSAASLAEAGRLLGDVDPGPWAGLHAFVAAPGALYPEPHSPLFDFTLRNEAKTGEVARIDELAALGAEARERDDAPMALFHCDWAARNIRIADGRLVASYDWDSLNACRESAAVGNAAATWRSTGEPDDPPAPGPEEIDAYLEAYLRCAGRFGAATRAWRAAATGEALWLLAYTARCEHAIEVRDPAVRPRRARDTLERHGAEFVAALGEPLSERWGSAS